MKLQTTISLKPERNQIDYDANVLLLGSCFAENIGEKLSHFKFQNSVNPFGILFHPVAIEKIVTRAINQEYFTEEDVFFHNEQWHCFEVHSKLSARNKEDFLANLNDQLSVLNTTIKEATHIILTFGTSWVYREIESDTLVANCYKLPQKLFLKELLSPDEVSGSVSAMEKLIKDFNHKTKIVYTVSPIRHIKEGIVENSRSKAHLLAGVHENVEPLNHSHYFPAYEIVLDELRDYRFYQEDMLHPNNIAISIIWEKFKHVWVSSETEPFQREIDIIQKGLQHRPFDENSMSHKEFLLSIEQKIKKLQLELPHLNF
jgi:hypothetical protein